MAIGSHWLASAWIHASQAVTTGKKEKVINETIKIGMKNVQVGLQGFNANMSLKEHVSGSTS